MDWNLATVIMFGILVTGITLSSIARYWAEAFKAKWQAQSDTRPVEAEQPTWERAARQRGLFPAPPQEDDDESSAS